MQQDEALNLLRTHADNWIKSLSKIQFNLKNETAAKHVSATYIKLNYILKDFVDELELHIRLEILNELAAIMDIPPSLVDFLRNKSLRHSFQGLSRSHIYPERQFIETTIHKLEENIRFNRLASNSQNKRYNLLTDFLRDPTLSSPLDHRTLRDHIHDYLNEIKSLVKNTHYPKLEPHNIPIDLFRQVITWISNLLKQIISDNWHIPEDSLDFCIEKSFHTISHKHQDYQGNTATDRLAHDLLLINLKNRQMIQLAKGGHFTLLIKIIALKSSIQETLIRRVLFENTMLGRVILFKSLSFSQDEFLRLEDVLEESRSYFSRKTYKREEFPYSLIDKSTAIRIADKWSRDRHFQDTLHALESIMSMEEAAS